MNNNTVKKIISCLVLLALCAATVAGVYLGIWGRTTQYADIPAENGGTQRQALYRQVAFIPNTINENWQEAIRPEAKLGGGYGYTFSFENTDANGLKDSAKVLTARAQTLAGSANAKIADNTVTVSVPETSYNGTLATVLSPKGAFDMVLYNAADGTTGEPVITAEHVKQTYYNTTGTAAQIVVQLNSKGVKAYNDLRAANSGSSLYLRLDEQPGAYATLSALGSNNTLTFSVSDTMTAYILVSCMRSGALPVAGTLTDSQPVAAESGAVRTLILLCAALCAVTAISMLILCRASGLVGIWSMVLWIVCFCLLASLIAVSTGWVMSSLSMIVMVICLIAFLYGLATLYGHMSVQLKHGRGTAAACADASRKAVKPLGIAYAAILLVGVVLMVAFRATAYGILGRIVAVAALVSFVMVFLFPRLVLGCFAALTGKK